MIGMDGWFLAWRSDIINDANEAEEITQEVFLLVWKKRATLPGEQGKVAAWLTGITRHQGD